MLLFGAALSAGCAAHPPPSAGATAASPAPPADYAAPTTQQKGAGLGEEAEDPAQALANAEKQLEVALGGEAGVSDPGPRPQPAPLGTDRCDVVCRALASIRRSADRLCELSTDDPGRCKDARARVTKAEDRARGACPTCAAPT
jgi:hypothetical protein